MHLKTFFFIQIATLVYGGSHSRYNNRVFRIRPRTHEALTDANDCEFNICENDAHYPEKDVRKIVSKHRSFHSFLKGNVIAPADTISISNREGSTEFERTFCETEDVTVVPKMMMDVDNVKRHIVNVKNMTQVLKFQKCKVESSECFKEVILNTVTKCEQKYNNIKLVAVDVNEGLLEYRTFKIPTTCVCTYMKEID